MDSQPDMSKIDSFITPEPGIVCGRCGTRVEWAEPFQDAEHILISVICPRCQLSMSCVVTQHGD